MSTQFLEAVKKGDRAVVDRMLDADPSLASAKDASGISAVLLAHYYGKADVAAALVAEETRHRRCREERSQRRLRRRARAGRG